METLTPQLTAYALTSTILGVHLILLAFWTGSVRVMRKQYVNPEDATLNKAPQVEADHPDVQRVKRAHMNALENAIPFFIIGALFVLTGASKSGAQIYFYTFLSVRLLHTVFYLWGKQPFRTLCFAIGALATLGMAAQVIRAIL